MASVEGMTGAGRADESVVSSAELSGLPAPMSHAPRVVLQHTHSTVCARRTSLAAHHPTVSGRRHQQIGHRERQADHSRYRSDPAGHQVAPSPHPRRRSVITCLLITAVLGLIYLGLVEVFHLDTHPELIWLGLLVIVFGGAVIENAIRLESMTGPASTPRRAGMSAFGESEMTPGLPA